MLAALVGRLPGQKCAVAMLAVPPTSDDKHRFLPISEPTQETDFNIMDSATDSRNESTGDTGL